MPCRYEFFNLSHQYVAKHDFATFTYCTGEQVEESNMRFMAKLNEMNGLVENVRQLNEKNTSLQELLNSGSKSAEESEVILEIFLFRYIHYEKSVAIPKNIG